MQRCINVLLGLLLIASVAFAQEHRVGRAKISFDSPGWIAVEVPDAGVKYSGEIGGTLASETKLFIHQDAGASMQALLIARVSKGGHAAGASYFHYSPKCTDPQALAAEGNSGFQRPFAQCLLVYPLFTTGSVIKQLGANEAEILKSTRIKLPDELQLIHAYYANENGSFMHARVYFSARFRGISSPTESSAKPTVAWGQELMKSVRAGVNSLTGVVKMPAVEFSAVSGEKALALLPAAQARE